MNGSVWLTETCTVEKPRRGQSRQCTLEDPQPTAQLEGLWCARRFDTRAGEQHAAYSPSHGPNLFVWNTSTQHSSFHRCVAGVSSFCTRQSHLQNVCSCTTDQRLFTSDKSVRVNSIDEPQSPPPNDCVLHVRHEMIFPHIRSTSTLPREDGDACCQNCVSHLS